MRQKKNKRSLVYDPHRRLVLEQKGHCMYTIGVGSYISRVTLPCWKRFDILELEWQHISRYKDEGAVVISLPRHEWEVNVFRRALSHVIYAVYCR